MRKSPSWRAIARQHVAAILVQARLRNPPLSPARLKAQLRALLVEAKVGSYRRRVLREEMRRAGAPYRSPPDLRQLELPWATP